MKDYAFRIVNVFAEGRLDGNPLAVFEDARGLSDETQQALALQFNLSETTFIFPSERATARVRIFTPSFEMPFAGHPTLGTAHVVRALRGDVASSGVTLEMKAGVIPVQSRGDEWTLRANAPKARPVSATSRDLAAMLGLDIADFAGEARWIDTGSEQLVIPLASCEAVRRAKPDAALLFQHGAPVPGEARALAYIFAFKDETNVLARFFFSKQTNIAEDPGTGSACANLGGYLLTQGRTAPFFLAVDQGEAVRRRCRLGLRVDESGAIHVSGNVIEIARGTLTI